MASYSKDVKTVLLLNVVGFAAGVGVQSSLAWFLMPEGRGQYAACVVVFASLLTLVCALGQEMANVYYIGAKKLTPSQAMTQSLIMAVLISFIACMIGYLLTLTSLPFLNKAPLALFRYSLLCIPAMLFQLYLTRIFLGMGKVSTFKYLIVGVQALLLIGLLITGAIGKLDVKTAILIQAGANATIALMALGLLIFHHGCRITRLELDPLLRSLGYGGRYYFGKLATLLNVQMATIILSFSAVRPDQLGLFSAAIALSSQILIIPGAIQIAMLPRVAADSKGESKMVAQSVRLCLVCCSIMTLVLFILSKPIITIFLSARFLPVLVPLWVLLPGVIFQSISRILPAYFAGIDRPQITSAVLVLSVVANLILIHLLLPIWGLTGAALANTVVYAAEAIVMGLAFQHYSGLPVWRLIRFNRGDYNALVQLWRRSRKQLPTQELEIGNL
jgi:O-antigen/teichoic acid export membrane protein